MPWPTKYLGYTNLWIVHLQTYWQQISISSDLLKCLEFSVHTVVVGKCTQFYGVICWYIFEKMPLLHSTHVEPIIEAHNGAPLVQPFIFDLKCIHFFFGSRARSSVQIIETSIEIFCINRIAILHSFIQNAFSAYCSNLSIVWSPYFYTFISNGTLS